MALFILELVSVITLVVTAIMAAVAIVFGHVIGFGRRLSILERWIVSWLVFDAQLHILLNGSFVALSFMGNINTTESVNALPWREAGKSDSRLLDAESTILSIHIINLFVATPMCLLTIVGVLTNTYYRHYTQLVTCICELYGEWMTFGPQWLIGSPNLHTGNLIYLWIYILFFHIVWVIFPFLLVCHSWLALKAVFIFRQLHGPGSKGSLNCRACNCGKMKKISGGHSHGTVTTGSVVSRAYQSGVSGSGVRSGASITPKTNIGTSV